jgi:hypothetical protein
VKEALLMIEGGWRLGVWPNADYDSYTAVFSAAGESDLVGHAETPRKAIRRALEGLGHPWVISPT